MGLSVDTTAEETVAFVGSIAAASATVVVVDLVVASAVVGIADIGLVVVA
jgi:hypothetical protein